MAIIDIVLLVLAAAALCFGYSRGIVKQIGSLAGFALAIMACHVIGGAAAAVVARCMDVDISSGEMSIPYYTASVIGYVAVFVVVWLSVWFMARVLRAAIKAVHLGAVDSVLGSLFMCFKTVLIASILLNVWLVLDADSRFVESGGAVTQSVVAFGPMLLGVVG